MKYLLDTCVISELTKPRPDRRVTEWIRLHPEENLYLSVLTLGELTRGISRLPPGRKRRKLEGWLELELKPRFAGRWLEFEADASERWGVISAKAEDAGRKPPVIDGMLAATAIVNGLTLATRNVADVRATGARIVNPWNEDME